LQSLSYADLATSLEVSSVRDLEDLIIDAMYSSLLGGKLDQKEGVLSVDWVVGRDVNREDQSLTELQNKLESWYV
jgi:COP9 signalosome complex subunit 7